MLLGYYWDTTTHDTYTYISVAVPEDGDALRAAERHEEHEAHEWDARLHQP